MCGIAGFVELGKRMSDAQLVAVVNRMATRLMHRGPDSSGCWVDASAGVGLAHRRLSIIDLSVNGSQPMISADGRFVITFNGEIYNYERIRDELKIDGYEFRGSSDTEVMLAAFSRWGVQTSLKKFVGMFAFGLWDRHDHKLYLARDRLGEKPLYYGWCGGNFVFGSELKALKAGEGWSGEIDRNVLALYFRYHYIPSPYSIYKGVFKLPPGSVVDWGIKERTLKELPFVRQYWSIGECASRGVGHRFLGSEKEAIDELEALLKQSVQGQMIGDVPIGAFLSGGVDSSAIVALMQAHSNRKVRTFSIGFESKVYNESGFAEAVAGHIGTEHTSLCVRAADALAVIPRLPIIYDEPFADSSEIPTLMVAELARKSVTVSLSGDGGDEVFCGYNRHSELKKLWNLLQRIAPIVRRGGGRVLESIPSCFWETVLGRAKSRWHPDQFRKAAMILRLDNPEDMYLRLVEFWDSPTELVLGATEIPCLLSEKNQWCRLPDYLERLLYLETATSLPDDMLVKVDRAGMAVSLETRMPFLDHRVLEFAWRLPLGLKLHSGVSKWILRQVLYRYVPRELVDRPKAGFAMPIDAWLRGPLRSWAEGLLDSGRIEREGFLNAEMVETKWREHLSGRRRWQQHLWSVLMYEAWLENETHRPGE